jgi:hypothetical protein
MSVGMLGVQCDASLTVPLPATKSMLRRQRVNNHIHERHDSKDVKQMDDHANFMGPTVELLA